MAAELAFACWGEGRDLCDWDVLRAVARTAGLSSAQVDSLEAQSAEPAAKEQLRANTEEAIARGVFGVPTFEHEDELYWGHDRLEQLGERLRGELPPARDRLEELVSRPAGAERDVARLRARPAPGT